MKSSAVTWTVMAHSSFVIHNVNPVTQSGAFSLLHIEYSLSSITLDDLLSISTTVFQS